jgi:hypothetical protein
MQMRRWSRPEHMNGGLPEPVAASPDLATSPAFSYKQRDASRQDGGGGQPQTSAVSPRPLVAPPSRRSVDHPSPRHVGRNRRGAAARDESRISDDEHDRYTRSPRAARDTWRAHTAAFVDAHRIRFLTCAGRLADRNMQPAAGRMAPVLRVLGRVSGHIDEPIGGDLDLLTPRASSRPSVRPSGPHSTPLPRHKGGSRS